MNKFKVVSDGTGAFTQVLYKGEDITQEVNIGNISVNIDNQGVNVTMTFKRVDFEIIDTRGSNA